MAEDKMQQQRFELKYIIKEDVARAVRDFVSGYLEIDEYGATLPDFSYPVHRIFFEIKRRMNNIIAKQRGGVRRDAVDWLLAGHLPEPAHLVSRDPRQQMALQNFCKLAQDICAIPKAHIAYLREAWISPRDNSVRVTLDRATMVGEYRFNRAFVLNHIESTTPEFESAAPRRGSGNPISKPTDG